MTWSATHQARPVTQAARLLCIGVLVLMLFSMQACSRTPKLPAIPAGATVLALGDSITAGNGATPDQAWPAVLAQLSGWKVVNAGIPGDVSAGALERLSALLAEHHPALTIVSIGGNDLLRRLPEDQSRANVLAIVDAVRASGSQVVLVAVPKPTLLAAAVGKLEDHPLYADLASERKIVLHPKGWSEVLSDPNLKSDQIHANAAGYRQFAEGLAATLKRSGLLR